jgi:hypothetical protein
LSPHADDAAGVPQAQIGAARSGVAEAAQAAPAPHRQASAPEAAQGPEIDAERLLGGGPTAWVSPIELQLSFFGAVWFHTVQPRGLALNGLSSPEARPIHGRFVQECQGLGDYAQTALDHGSILACDHGIDPVREAHPLVALLGRSSFN